MYVQPGQSNAYPTGSQIIVQHQQQQPPNIQMMVRFLNSNLLSLCTQRLMKSLCILKLYPTERQRNDNLPGYKS